MNAANDNDNYTFATKEQALEAATKALVLEIQSEYYDEYPEDRLMLETVVEPEAEFDGWRWWAKLIDTERGAEGIVSTSLSVEWVG